MTIFFSGIKGFNETINSIESEKLIASINRGYMVKGFEAKPNFPFSISVWDDSVKLFIYLCIFYYFFFIENSQDLIVYKIMFFGAVITLPVLLIFYELGVFKYTFIEDAIIVKYLYGRKKNINKNQFVKINYLQKNRKIEIHYKKSRKHSTKIISIPVKKFDFKKFSSDELLQQLRDQYFATCDLIDKD